MKGVLLVNLGSPDTPEPKDVKVYLEEFLMDPRVVDLPKPLRTLLVKGIILNTVPNVRPRPTKKSGGKRGRPSLCCRSVYKRQFKKWSACQ